MRRVLFFLLGTFVVLIGCSGRPSGPLACGDAITCDGKTQYCQLTSYAQPIDDAGTTQTAECVAFPTTCSSASCDCFGGVNDSGCGCSETQSGVTVGQCTP